jgi:hypothetical protein
MNQGDYETSPGQYTYSNEHSYKRVIPDFNFHGWPQAHIHDYDETITNITQSGMLPALINKVGWIGNLKTNKRRTSLYTIGKSRSDLFDIIDMEWKNTGKVELAATQYMSIPDLVKTYSVLIDIEGNGYSARVKYLLWSRRPLLLVDRPHKEYFYEYMKEWEHYIPVKRDLSDLVEKTEWYMSHYNEASKIAESGYKFAQKYLTRDMCYKQFIKVLIENN